MTSIFPWRKYFQIFWNHFLKRRQSFFILHDSFNILGILFWNIREEFWKLMANVSQMTKTRRLSLFRGTIESFFTISFTVFEIRSLIHALKSLFRHWELGDNFKSMQRKKKVCIFKGLGCLILVILCAILYFWDTPHNDGMQIKILKFDLLPMAWNFFYVDKTRHNQGLLVVTPRDW